ncbi:uncharacterized protein N7483_006036 [Penicillium malachiteum]|uniref:uncharacterized protein n=1 Tax=Penicillium malachiteum TaxID=1324776 RepID=UPI0025467F6E|nr:uncharacterized protein N7483_006036 [Penicillium malachiteum]KAJ5731528.1 hypothetical protein N7483_006036 [Penicillium malachiteum]
MLHTWVAVNTLYLLDSNESWQLLLRAGVDHLILHRDITSFTPTPRTEQHIFPNPPSGPPSAPCNDYLRRAADQSSPTLTPTIRARENLNYPHFWRPVLVRWTLFAAPRAPPLFNNGPLASGLCGPIGSERYLAWYEAISWKCEDKDLSLPPLWTPTTKTRGKTFPPYWKEAESATNLGVTVTRVSLPDNGVLHAVMDGYKKRGVEWSKDLNSKGVMEWTRKPRGSPVTIRRKGIKWVPVFGRYFALTGRNPTTNKSYADSWLFNWKAEAYSDAEHSDIHFWLGLVMPDSDSIREGRGIYFVTTEIAELVALRRRVSCRN